MKRFFCLFLGILSLSVMPGAAAFGAERQTDNVKAPLMVPPASGAIAIDGTVDEAAWRDALRLELKYEVRPRENVEPDVRTELFITHDDTRLYIAFKCYDPEPSSIRARYSDRDRQWSDDWCGVVLDTFNDQRHAFEFFSNPLGVQGDMANDDILGEEDASWNAIWDSAGRITADGYEVEMAIPFSQLSFQSTGGTQIWGIDAIRSWPRENRAHIGLFPRQRGNNSYLSQTVKITGFDGIQPGRNLEIAPTLTTGRTEERSSFPDGALEEKDSKVDPGVTVRWGLTPNITVNGTLNPDFSQIEADEVQLDINRPFSLYFNETRPFFLDGATYFNTPRITTVYTRTIVDPNVAVKLTGKEGPHTFGVFLAEDDTTALVLPGAEGSRRAVFNQNTMAAVGRYRYDFGGSSTVGAVFTDREGDGYHNRVFALDGNYRFTDNDYVQFSAAGSSTRYNDAMAARFGTDTEEHAGHGLNAIYAHRDRNWFYQAAYMDFADEFRVDLGWQPQVGFRKLIVGGGREFWGGEGDFYNRLTISGDWDRTEKRDGSLLEEEVEAYLQGTLALDTYFNFGGGKRTMAYNGVEFEQNFWGAYLEGNPVSMLWASIGMEGGDWIDFAHTRPATEFNIEPGFDLRFGRHLTISYYHEFSYLDVAAGRLFTAHVPQTRLTWQHDERTRLRAIFQYVNIERDPTLYAFDVEKISKDLLSQILFSYKINAQTVLYLGYSDTYVGGEEFGLTQLSRTVFAKIGYAWLE